MKLLMTFSLVVLSILSLVSESSAQNRRERARQWQQISAAEASARRLESSAHQIAANAVGRNDALRRDWTRRYSRMVSSGGAPRAQALREARARVNEILNMNRQAISVMRQAQNAWRQIIPLKRAYFVEPARTRVVRGIESHIRNLEAFNLRINKVNENVSRHWNTYLNR